MAATIELKYFNTFWLKKIKTITNVVPGSTSVYVSNAGTSFVISPALTLTQMNVGQRVTFTYGATDYSGYILTVTSTTTFTVNIAPTPVVTGTPTITFGKIINFDNIPKDYAGVDADDWYIEEARIRGGYNNLTVDFGVKAYLVEDTSVQQNRMNSMIYSGVFNSRTGVNNTNQFSVGVDITRSADPANGSIQRLYAEDTNLVIFQEDKVSRALIDKDAIYSAEGSALTTSGAKIIGQIIAYAGEYGISTNPESFAVYGYRKYFTDRKRGCVLRLTGNGIEEISSFGMHDYFRDQLSTLTQPNTDKVFGVWDMHVKNYVVSIQNSSIDTFTTLSFDEDVRGWTSFFSYKPNAMFSLNNAFYSYDDQKLYQHYLGSYGNFYGTAYDSTVKVILNAQPSLVKNFKTINYEGAIGWEVESMNASSGDTILPISKYIDQTTLLGLEGYYLNNSFKRKENKYFANLLQPAPGDITPQSGEIVWGRDVSGIKGFWSTVQMKLANVSYPITKKELFAVSSNTVESSY